MMLLTEIFIVTGIEGMEVNRLLTFRVVGVREEQEAEVLMLADVPETEQEL